MKETIYCEFEIGKDRLPDIQDNGACVIAFVPHEGFQWARYFNGSKTWQSMITRETITPTHWMLPKNKISQSPLSKIGNSMP